MPDPDAALDDDIGDELLRLIFTACHPRLSREARAALALRMICGLTTEEIARAFLQPEATIAQRIVRAKRTLSESGLAYETPRGEALSERLASVLEVVYLIFNEGYTAARGDEWLRPQLCNDALRMGRVLTRGRAAGSRSPRPARADGAERFAHRGAHRCGRRSDSPDGPEPDAVGPASDPPRACRRWRGRTNSAAGADSTRCRRRSSPVTPERPRLMTRSGRASQISMPNSRPGALADHRAQPRGRRRHGRGAGGGARDRGRTGRRARAEELSSPGKRPRRSAFQARPLCRSQRGIRGRSKNGGQQART